MGEDFEIFFEFHGEFTISGMNIKALSLCYPPCKLKPY
jgi:hypothetical protein